MNTSSSNGLAAAAWESSTRYATSLWIALRPSRSYAASTRLTGGSWTASSASARMTARLDHPSIVPVYNVGQVDGSPYVVSKLIEGSSLSALMAKAGPIPPRRAARIIGDIAEALHFAHEHAVVHRDVKPSNIMIDPDGNALLTDFGLARSLATDDEASFTMEGAVIGTPSYMSPEQAEGRLDAVGRASDVYSLGATLFALLVGRSPFAGKSAMETIQMVRDVEPQPPRRIDPAIPRDLEAICLKAMSKRIIDRYPSARAMADDLRCFLDGRPIAVRTPGPVERMSRWIRRRPSRFAAILATFAIFALLAVQQIELQKARSRPGTDGLRAPSRRQPIVRGRTANRGQTRRNAHARPLFSP